MHKFILLVGVVMILSWIINIAPTAGRACASGVEQVQSSEGTRAKGATGEKQWLGTLYAEQGAPYCTRESRSKDTRREDTEQKEMKKA